MGFWLPQNLQKRLLLRVLQNISIFSNLDLSNLDISLGSNSKFSFSNINLYVSELHVPYFDVKNGSLDQLDLNLNVSGGVDINGKGIHFILVIKHEVPEQEDITFSLTKSIQNITESILDFSDTNKEIDNKVNKSNNASHNNNSGQIPGTFNKILESDSELDPQKSTGLQNMRNKVLNLILNKMTVILQDITIEIEDTLGNCQYEISLDMISLLSREDNLRQVSIKGLSIFHNKSDHESYYASKLSNISVYMSALESFNELYDIQFTKVKLLTLDSVQLSFQGLSNIEDLSITNITIDVDKINVFLSNIIDLTDDVFIHIIRIIKRFLETNTTQGNKEQSKSPSGTKSYTRTDLLSYICIKTICFQIFNDTIITFEQLYLNQVDNGDIKLNIDNFKSTNQDFQIKIDTKPIIKGTIHPNSIIVKLNSCLDVKLNRTLFLALSKFYKQFHMFANIISEEITSLSNNLTNMNNMYTTPNNKYLTITGESVSLSIEESDCIFSLILDPFKFNTKEWLFNCKKLSGLLNNRYITEEIINIKDISLQLHNKKQKITTFNEALQDIYAFTNLIIRIDSIIIYISKDQIQILLDRFAPILNELFQELKSKENTGKIPHTRRDIRNFLPKNNKRKHNLICNQTIFVYIIKYRIRDIFKETSLGIIKGKLRNNIFLFPSIGNEIIFTSNRIELKRMSIGSEQSETIVRSISYSKKNKPSFYIQISAHKDDTKYKVKLNNTEMTYKAEWLNILREMEMNLTKENDQTESRSLHKKLFPTIDLSFTESSLLLHPYRLNTCLLISFDYQNAYIESSDTLHINSVMKNANVLMIDDFSEIIKPEAIKIRDLTNFYTSQGFCLIGKAKNFRIVTTNFNNTIDVTVNIEKLSLLLCADSFNSLIQTCIDLKYPETFPDEKKYQTYFNHDINVLEYIDMDFFNKEENDTSKTKSSTFQSKQNSLNIIEDFLDITSQRQNVSHTPTYKDQVQTTNNESLKYYNSNLEIINISSQYIDKQKVTKNLNKNRSLEHDNNLSISINLNIATGVIKLFDGYDWAYTRKKISEELSKLNSKWSKTEGNNHRYDLNTPEKERNLFNSIYITSNPNIDTKKAVVETIQGSLSENSVYNNQINLHPSKHYKLLINLEQASVTINHFNTKHTDDVKENYKFDIMNSIDISLQSFEVIDNLETSTWNKFASLLRHEHWSINDLMLHVHLDMVRPLNYLEAIEYILNVTISPLRLHIDQDTLDFVLRFLGFQDSRFDLIDDYPDTFFIQRFEIDPVKIVLDYKPKKVNYVALKSGYINELMNLFTINGSSVVLKKAVLHGLNGFKSLGMELQKIWKPDILKRQMSGVLGGISPLKTFISLGSGVKTLVTVLTSHYNQETIDKNNNNINLQWNPKIYLKTSTGRLVQLSANLVIGTQNLLETTEAIFGGPGSTTRLTHGNAVQDVLDVNKLLGEDQLIGKDNPTIKGKVPSALVIDTTNVQNGKVKPHVVSLYANQPLNIQEGLEEAYRSLEKHLQVAYNMVWKRKDGYVQSINNVSPSAAAVSVAKIAPIAIIRPLIGTTEAVSKTLQGFANQLDHDNIIKVKDKYKSGK